MLVDLYRDIVGLDRAISRQPRHKEVVFCDVECYRALFYVAFKRQSDGRRIGFEHSHRKVFDHNRVRRIMRANTVVTFNGLTYDVPMIYKALSGTNTVDLKRCSDRIIKGGIRWWDVESELEIAIPNIDHIDLIEPNPAVMQSLKVLNGRLHGRRLQDLPYPEDADLTEDQMDDVIDYCLVSDLDATENVFNALKEPLELRVALGQQYDLDFRSKSDAQMGEGIIKKRITQLTGNRPQKNPPKPGSTFQYRVPDWMEFETPVLQDLLRKIRNTDFIIKADGKVEKPETFEDFKFKLGHSTYSFGIGGLHSTEKNRAVRSDDDYVLVDADVASQYPAIIMKLGLYPAALGKDFLRVYGGLIKDRLEAKKNKDKVKDKAGKIALNGAYGKLGSRFSILYAPHLLIAVTLTGQLSLLMLIERAEKLGIPVVSGNTDGVLFKCPRDVFEGIEGDRPKAGLLKEITDWWEARSGFKAEFNEIRAIYNQSVNTYIAIKADGKVKRKGPIGNPWSSRPEENDVRAQMMKNPQMTICSDAVLEHIFNGTPIEQTIRQSRDVRGFVTVVNAAGGATWRNGYLGKVVRYIWSTDGDPIIKVKPHPSTGNRPKVPKTEGCRPLMTLPDEFPADIDYDRYIAEAEKILSEIGFHEKGSEPMKDLLLRVLKFN